MNKKFSIEKALDFGSGVPYVPVNMIELQYETDDGNNTLHLKMRDETTGFGTRHAGRQLKTKVQNFIESKPGYIIIVDWSGIPVITSSFADEFMGKLFLELGPTNFMRIIRNINSERLVNQLIDKAIMQRLTQEKDQ